MMGIKLRIITCEESNKLDYLRKKIPKWKFKKEKEKERYIYIKIYAGRTPCCFYEKGPMFPKNQKRKKKIKKTRKNKLEAEG